MVVLVAGLPKPRLSHVFRTKSWALPGESQEEQSKGLDGLASSILALAKKPGRPHRCVLSGAPNSLHVSRIA